MPRIFDLIQAKEIGVYISESNSNRIPYLGEILFPPKKQLGLDLSWIKGSKGLPVALTPSAFDAKATLRDRIGFSKVETEMPFFREAMRIGEKERQELNKLLASSNSAYIAPLIKDIYDDTKQLVEGAEVQNERMRMQLLSSGKISILANRIAYDYDYKFDKTHMETLTSTHKWSDLDNSDPVGDIMRYQNSMADCSGVILNKAICSRKTFNYIIGNKRLRKDMNSLTADAVIVTDSMVKDYLQKKLGLSIAIYDKKYRDETGKMQSFFPDDVLTLIPDGSLGNTYYGTTPEESDLMGGGTEAQTSIVNTGVAVTTIKEPHPVNVQTIVSEIALPSFEQMDNIFIAKVA